ncbi:MAG: hypothetical protein EOP56_14430 [Sphingobacteriales bacterium]|nr:MAG: hypothetical protein EOP56_14430 [Sphingobacteriales bacterium]
MNAADKYFLKAKDNYPHDLDKALEALEYGLSCDNEHAGLLTLQGTIYHNDLKQFDAAEECFELALFYNKNYVDTWYSYITFAIEMNDLTKADKLIQSAMKVRGTEIARIYYRAALLADRKGAYAEAVDTIQKARLNCCCKECYDFLKDETDRLQMKLKVHTEQNSMINIILT